MIRGIRQYKTMKLSKFIFNQIFGWKTVNVMPDTAKCVIAIAPHTSNWDFIVGKLAYSSIGRTANFLIKKEWFFFPFNLFFRSIGGIPIRRDKNSSMTDVLATEFDKHHKLQIAVTPEGTRKRTSEWKKGFYYIALKANVPILLVGLDYQRKEAIFLDYFTPTGNFDADIIKIKSYYQTIVGKYPEKFAL